MRRLTIFVLMVASACGGKQVVDAGTPIDTSCGIDCAAQAHYGLLVGTCFEYSSTTAQATPPDLAVEVFPKVELEGGLAVMQLRYTTGGQRKQQDSFAIVNGELKLVRREFGAGGISASYKNDAMSLEGVKWLARTSAAGENYTTSTNADVVSTGARVSDATMYRVALSAAPSSELDVPLKTYTEGLKLLFTESPTEHGTDSRRVFVPDVGFTLISTPLLLTGGTALEYRLQNIKNTADAGTLCGF